jgi:hypothetical protein
MYLHRLSPGNGFQLRSFLSFRAHALTGRRLSHNSNPGWRPSLSCHCRPSPLVIRVRVTLRLPVYRQSVRLGAKPLEAHVQRFFMQINPFGHSPYVTSFLSQSQPLFIIYLRLGPQRKHLSKQLFYYCMTWLSLEPRRKHHSCVNVYGHYLATAVVYRVII